MLKLVNNSLLLCMALLSSCSGLMTSTTTANLRNGETDSDIGIDVAIFADDESPEYPTASEPVPVSGTNLAAVRKLRVEALINGKIKLLYEREALETPTRIKVDPNQLLFVSVGNRRAVVPKIGQSQVEDGKAFPVFINGPTSAAALLAENILTGSNASALVDTFDYVSVAAAGDALYATAMKESVSVSDDVISQIADGLAIANIAFADSLKARGLDPKILASAAVEIAYSKADNASKDSYDPEADIEQLKLIIASSTSEETSLDGLINSIIAAPMLDETLRQFAAEAITRNIVKSDEAAAAAVKLSVLEQLKSGSATTVKAIVSSAATQTATASSTLPTPTPTAVPDTTPPTDTSIEIEGGAAKTNKSTVDLQLAATGADSMYITENQDCNSGGIWEPFVETKQWSLGQTNGTATIYAKFKDAAANVSACVSAAIVHDDLGPSAVTIVIAEGASEVNATAISLTLSALDAKQMYVTNTPGCSADGVWETYATSKAWTLAQSNQTTTVFVKMRDDLGNESACVSDSIVHDDTAPADVSLSINAGAASVNTTGVTLTLTATDATEMYLTSSPGCTSGGTWETFSTTKAWTLSQSNATASVYAKFRDSVGNESACVFDNIVHDTVPPSSTSISIESGTSIVNSTSVTLTLAATDAAQMYVTNTAGCAAGGVWESYASGKAWTLAQTNATATVYVKFRDSTFNESGCIFDDILHDDIAPTSTSIVINNGDATASSTSVTLTLAATGATQMYITNAATCASGGVWEAYATTKAWTLPSTTTSEFVYVAFSDAAGNISGCISDSIGYAANAFIYGSTSDSMLDGTPILCNASPYCTSGSPWVIPEGTQIKTLTMVHGAYVTISNDVTIEDIVINGASVLRINVNETFVNVTVNSGTITGSAFASGEPGPGNGKLQFTVTGALINAGTIHADALGYLSTAGGAGQSFDGTPGTGGGKYIYNGLGGGGSYGSFGGAGGGGSSATYGAADFQQTAKLYLGSAGSGYRENCGTECSDDLLIGGKGGGALYVNAGSISNSGTISADGQAGPQYRTGGGSGGSVVLIASGAFGNSGTIRALGGSGNAGAGAGGRGRIYVSHGSLADASGSFDPAPHQDYFSSVYRDSVTDITIDATSVAVTTNSGTDNFGAPMIGTGGAADFLSQFAGQTLSSLTIPNGTFVVNHSLNAATITVSGATIDFEQPMTVTTLNVSGGTVRLKSTFTTTPDLVHTAGTIYLHSAPTFNDITVGSGGSIATIYGIAYDGTWGGATWTTTPGPGNGQLHLLATGDITVGSNGRISVSTFGYPSFIAGHGGAFDGRPGTGGGRYQLHLGASGGSYGTIGASSGAPLGTVFGSGTFFELDKLYLGSSGGGALIDCGTECSDDPYIGGKGGGALYVEAQNFQNAGIISANGQTSPQYAGGGGSGGTIAFIVSGAFGNTGTIEALGGGGVAPGGAGGRGRIYVSGFSLGSMAGGLIDPLPDPSFLSLFNISASTSITLGSTTSSIVADSVTYNFGAPMIDDADGYCRFVDSFSGMTIGTVTLTGGKHRVTATGDIGTITMTGGTFDIQDTFAINQPNLAATAGTIYMSVSANFNDVSIGTDASTTTITTSAYAGTWSGSTWSSTPGPANGIVQFALTGDLTVGANGVISADFLGYQSALAAHGFSFDGQGTGGGRYLYGQSASGGSYGTAGEAAGAGASSTFGAADFETELYLGTGGGGAMFWCGTECSDDPLIGARGAGSINITATNITNDGIISANGQAATQHWTGGGSGGSVVISATAHFSNAGVIRALGGAGGPNGGGAGGKGRQSLTGSTQTIWTGTVDPPSS